VIVGTEFADDAAVVRLQEDDERCLVLTTDVIAPIVDDPELFGEIAAVNALSDVYAMGGAPRFVLNLVFFCDEKLPLAVLHAVLRGGARACRRAGAPVVGGHSVRDPEIKFGLAVTGEVGREQLLSNRTGRAGQVLVLTKALGTGVIGTAIKQGVASAEELAAAVASMTCLNDQALAAARNHGVSACTDVTGFGLLGHLRNILRGSSLAARLDMHALPALPGVLGHIEAGRVPGGAGRASSSSRRCCGCAGWEIGRGCCWRRTPRRAAGCCSPSMSSGRRGSAASWRRAGRWRRWSASCCRPARRCRWGRRSWRTPEARRQRYAGLSLLLSR